MTTGSSWTNQLDDWSAVDNGATVTFTKGDGGGSAHAVLATLSEGGVALVRRLVEGNVRASGARSSRTTTSVTFSKTLTLAASAATYLHGQPGIGMSS